MPKPAHEVAHVLERNAEELSAHCTNSWQARTLHALRKCRTAALGGHIDQCDHAPCNMLHLSYNSCRNRHCPKCQGHKREQWIRAREEELLRVPYFHVVFTLPHELNGLCLRSPGEMYGLLFKTAWSVIRDFAANPAFMGASTGMVAILHTWGQNLSLHPHLHCIVPGGGITAGDKWKYARNRGKYLFPEDGMALVFRARFAEGLRKGFDLPRALYGTLFSKNWVVYCRQHFYGPEQVVEYLGRYTHKVAITNHRIKDLSDGRVTFSAKDYTKGGARHDLTLTDAEFIRRFARHVLPKGFVRIRHYGILSSYHKGRVLPVLRKALGGLKVKQRPPLRHRLCRACKTGKMVTVATFTARGPPRRWLARIELQERT